MHIQFSSVLIFRPKRKTEQNGGENRAEWEWVLSCSTTSPLVTRIVKGYLSLTSQTQRHWGQRGCAVCCLGWLGSVVGGSWCGMWLREKARRNHYGQEMRCQNCERSKDVSVLFTTSSCTWLKSTVLGSFCPPVTIPHVLSGFSVWSDNLCYCVFTLISRQELKISNLFT